MIDKINAKKEEYREIIIRDVNDYLMQISRFRKAIVRNEGRNADAQQFFFRGQANIGWDVIPSVFRENYLSSESLLIKEAFLRDPAEFGALYTDFEKLAKLQHYGLPTRLLDVTSNPLVALYFACKKCEARKSKEDDTLFETDGVVFFKRGYGKGYNDVEIRIVSYLANRGVEGGISLSDLLNELVDKKLYSSKAALACMEMNYISLIEILQNNYFVVSNMNNERLVRQNGSFLLVGKYNINYHLENVGDSIIQVAQSSAKTDFENTVFRIPYDKKEAILDELDFYNINEGSLFPELEHQMSYIKQFQSNKLSEIGTFTKTDPFMINENIQPLETKLLDEDIEMIIDEVLLSSVNRALCDDCKMAIMDNLSVDWYRRDAVLCKIKIALTDALGKYNMDRIDAKRIANMIVNNIITKIDSVANS